MKKFCLVLLAMIVPFLAVDLHAASNQGNKRKAPVKKTASTNAKRTTVAGRSSVRKPSAANASKRTTVAGRSKAPVRNSSTGGSRGSSAAEDRELASIKSEEDQVARNEASLKKGISIVIKEVRALDGKLASMEDQLNQVVAEVGEVDKSVALTCGANGGGQSVPGLGDGSDDFNDDGMDMDDDPSYAGMDDGQFDDDQDIYDHF